jgi:hypothetical protein
MVYITEKGINSWQKRFLKSVKKPMRLGPGRKLKENSHSGK